MNAEYDKIDISILGLLKDNCKLTNDKIANKLNIHPNTVISRIKKMEADKLIKQYSISLDCDMLGLGISAFFWLSLRNGHLMKFDSIKDIIEIEQVEILGVITGYFNIAGVIKAKSIEELEKIIDIVSKNKFVKDIDFSLILSTPRHFNDSNPFIAKPYEDKPIKSPVNISELEKAILGELLLNSKQPLTKIAKKLNASVSTIKTKIKNMETNGLIKRYVTYIDYSKLGYTDFGMIKIKFHQLEKKQIKDATAKLLEDPNVVDYRSIIGHYNATLFFISKGKSGIYQLIKKINTIPQIDESEVQISYAFLKSHGEFNPLKYIS
jgi:DNA-binding Lrp family transcriptional regulator